MPVYNAVIAIMALSLLNACGVSAEDHQAIKDQADDGWWYYRNLTQKTEAVDDAVATLRIELDRMDTEDWKDVVPDLRAAVEQLEANQAEAHDASAK